MVQGEALVPDGEYTLQLTVLATSTATVSMPFSWPQDFGEVVEEEVVETIAPERFEPPWNVDGSNHPTRMCRHGQRRGKPPSSLPTQNPPHLTPPSDVQGSTSSSPEPSPACADLAAPSVEVVEVRMEETLPSEEEPAVAAPVEELAPVSQSSPVITVVSVVVMASILSLFVVAASTNEALRLPATMAGLWFLGLLGKTHETTSMDGRYQRGRLMGYLTANPGCHFRALMSALDMSNGQITHHLRILETEEHVWRKNDGRLVRFYPLTNQLHPGTKEEDLPVPPLPPDPNSLQG